LIAELDRRPDLGLFQSDGSVGKNFNADGAVGSKAEAVGGPFSKDGVVGKQ